MAKTRDEKIQEMVDAVLDWDTDSLIDFAQATLEGSYRGMSGTEVDQEYANSGLGDFDDDEEEPDTDDLVIIPVLIKPPEEQCSCGRMKDLGKTCWWCGL